MTFHKVFRESEELTGLSVDVAPVVYARAESWSHSRDHHNHLTLAPAIKLAEKDSLPTT